MYRFIQDIRYATRGLIKTPAFTIGVVLTLALGIGINATMFGIVDTLFLRTPPGVNHPAGVVRINLTQNFGSMGVRTGPSTTFPSYLDWHDHTTVFSSVAAITSTPMGLGRGAGAIQVNASAVSAEYFSLLELQPALGHFFTAAEDRIGGDRVAVLSYPFWQRHFGGDPSIIGRALPLGKGTYTVIGVGPKGFTGINLLAADLFLPIHPAAEGDVNAVEAIGSRNYTWISVIARIKPGVSAIAARAEATKAFRQGVSVERDRDTTSQVTFGSMQEARGPQASSDSRVALWIGIVAAAVLLIACANVANLLLARGVNRRRELAVRASLGAGRGGLMRALLAESLVLALAGGLSAVLLALWAGGAARTFLLPGLPPDATLIDGRVLLFTVLAIVLTAILTGIVPAVQASRTDLVSALKNGARGASGHGNATRATLLMVQIALTVVLLVGAGLFVTSLRKVQGIDLGMDADRVLSVRLDLGSAGMSPAEANQVYLRLLDQFQRLPGVERAAASMGMPFGNSWGESVRAEGQNSIPAVKSGGPYFQAVTPEYLATMGTRILRGRDFTAGDVAGNPPVTIIGATFAKLVWPGQDPIGKCLYVGNDSVSTCTRVVGVAADAKRYQVTDMEPMLRYMPLAQRHQPTINGIEVRARVPARGLIAALQREVQAFGNLPYARIQLLSDQVAPQMRSWRLGASAFTAFGLLALLIAATGIFAVLSYSVSQRTREIGLRVALGAQSAHVVRMVVGQGVRAAVMGVLFGAVGAYALGRAIASLLYKVPPSDPLVFGGVVATLLAVAGMAAYLPARRASRVAPMIALRSE